jgi:hypothetical protein
MVEPTTVGLTSDGHDKLRRLKEDGHFAEMTDGYRFAIALALAHGAVPTVAGQRGTIFNVGTLDPERQLYTAIKALYEPLDEPVYSIAERLAEWGVIELSRMAETSTLSFARILEEAEALQNRTD